MPDHSGHTHGMNNNCEPPSWNINEGRAPKDWATSIDFKAVDTFVNLSIV